jgi:hypothetical protein
MTEHSVAAEHGDWQPAPPGLAFSDYREWVDEGTTSRIDDVAARAADPAADRAAVPAPRPTAGSIQSITKPADREPRSRAAMHAPTAAADIEND